MSATAAATCSCFSAKARRGLGVQLEQPIAGLDRLVVRYGERLDDTVHLRRDGNEIGLHIGVVGIEDDVVDAEIDNRCHAQEDNEPPAEMRPRLHGGIAVSAKQPGDDQWYG
jgi:hypothetical protein